jgi:hypothetical protein
VALKIDFASRGINDEIIPRRCSSASRGVLEPICEGSADLVQHCQMEDVGIGREEEDDCKKDQMFRCCKWRWPGDPRSRALSEPREFER